MSWKLKDWPTGYEYDSTSFDSERRVVTVMFKANVPVSANRQYTCVGISPDASQEEVDRQMLAWAAEVGVLRS